jgi:hypothetical protein
MIHKFHVGQSVALIPRVIRQAAAGTYEITRLMPENEIEPHYRIKRLRLVGRLAQAASHNCVDQYENERKRRRGHEPESDLPLTCRGLIPIEGRKHPSEENCQNEPFHRGTPLRSPQGRQGMDRR